jgi:hypothetical protein
MVAGIREERKTTGRGEKPTGQGKEKCGICSPGDYLLRRHTGNGSREAEIRRATKPSTPPVRTASRTLLGRPLGSTTLGPGRMAVQSKDDSQQHGKRRRGEALVRIDRRTRQFPSSHVLSLFRPPAWCTKEGSLCKPPRKKLPFLKSSA